MDEVRAIIYWSNNNKLIQSNFDGTNRKVIPDTPGKFNDIIIVLYMVQYYITKLMLIYKYAVALQSSNVFAIVML